MQCTEISTRLVSPSGDPLGVKSDAGILQMNDGYNGWHFVCDDIFDTSIHGPNVACRELGYIRGERYAPPQAIDMTNAWYDDISCAGTENHLKDCSFVLGTAINCGPGEEVGLRCFGGTCGCGPLHVLLTVSGRPF
jgi:hypothetical protein